MSWLAVLIACGPAPEPAPTEAEAVEVAAWLSEAPKARGGVLVLQTSYDPSGSIEVQEPAARGLEFVQEGDPTRELVGDREVITQRFRFTGAKGSYEIGPVEARWSSGAEDAEAASTPVFVDLGVEPTGREGLADIVEPPPIRTIPWGAIGAVGGVALLLFGGTALAFRTPGAAREVDVVPEPPDVLALRAWEAVRADPALDDHATALALSRIFRTYLEAVLAFSATSSTTTEILDQLRQLEHLPEGNVERARRLLRATDRVKFADARATDEVFDGLDDDLRMFVAATRPRAWEAT